MSPQPGRNLNPFATQFMFATGIENSYPTISLPDGKTLRVDEMEKCGHYKHWREDFQLVKDLGIEFLRYGPPCAHIPNVRTRPAAKELPSHLLP